MALFVTHAAAAGGAEHTLLTYLRERPGIHRVLVLSDGECCELFAPFAAGVECVAAFGPAAPGRDLGPAAAARAATRLSVHLPAVLGAVHRSGERVVVTNSMKAHALAPVIAACGHPVGMRLHDMLAGSARLGPTGRRLIRAAARSAVCTAAVSEAAARAARQAGVQRVRWFHNGVAVVPARPGGRPHAPLRAVVVADLTPWKGVDAALRAVAAARGGGATVTLDVVGGETFHRARYAERLQALSAELGLSDSTRWHGRIADPSRVMAACDVLVHLPAEPDPLPTAVIEAQAVGLPVIGRDSGGLAEIVEHGGSGLLGQSGDPAEIAALLSELTDARLYVRLSDGAATRAAQRFSSRLYAERFDEWLEAVAA